jgi:hypothetical protein
MYLSCVDDIDRGEKMPQINSGAGLFERLTSGTAGDGLTELHEARWHGPVAETWLDRPFTQQDFAISLGNAADHD